MKSFVNYAAIAALTALPIVAEAQGKGHGNGKGGGKSHAAQGNSRGNGQNNGHGNGHKNNDSNRQSTNGNGNGKNDARTGANVTTTDLARIATGLAAANGISYLNPDVDFTTIRDADLVSIANCPPGLAKKNPPCVPPGLAKKGVTYDDWTGYDQDALPGLLDDRWTTYNPQDASPRDTDLTQAQAQAQITRIFDLPTAPEGKRYAVIDGRPVLLSGTDYDRLRTLNSLAKRPTLAGNVPIATDAALTQEELIARYGLPALAAGQNYSVLDNQLIALPDQSYDLLQLIRILGAV